MSKLFTKVLNLFYPPKCTFCRRTLPLSSTFMLCKSCADEIPFCLSYECCDICGKPIDDGMERCSFCREHPKAPYRALAAAYLYRGAVRRSIVRFKHEKFLSYADVYAAHMAAVIRYRWADQKFDGVVSVPPSKARMRKENYDQAEHLARALARELKLPYLKRAMYQTEEHTPQHQLSAKERQKAAERRYGIWKRERLQGKTLLLADDICTTRATLWGCAAELKRAGAKAVYGVVAATVREE